MRCCGIDYSMSSPAICVFDGAVSEFDWKRCKFYVTDKRKKYSNISMRNIEHTQLLYECDEDRFSLLANWARNILDDADKIFIEGYSYSSRGQVFQIGENTGVLKHFLYESGLVFDVIPPTVIKKFTTGKGNAKKDAMYSAWLNETGCDLMSMFFTEKKEKITSPVTDIVDSYFVLKTGLFQK